MSLHHQCQKSNICYHVLEQKIQTQFVKNNWSDEKACGNLEVSGRRTKNASAQAGTYLHMHAHRDGSGPVFIRWRDKKSTDNSTAVVKVKCELAGCHWWCRGETVMDVTFQCGRIINGPHWQNQSVTSGLTPRILLSISVFTYKFFFHFSLFVSMPQIR